MCNMVNYVKLIHARRMPKKRRLVRSHSTAPVIRVSVVSCDTKVCLRKLESLGYPTVKYALSYVP